MAWPLLAAHSGTIVHLSHQNKGLGSSVDFSTGDGCCFRVVLPKNPWQLSCLSYSRRNSTGSFKSFWHVGVKTKKKECISISWIKKEAISLEQGSIFNISPKKCLILWMFLISETKTASQNHQPPVPVCVCVSSLPPRSHWPPSVHQNSSRNRNY